MSSLGTQITAAIKTALEGIDGTGSYTHDLSDDGVVRIASEDTEGGYPSVTIEPAGMKSGRAAVPSGSVGRVALNQWGRAYTRLIWARVDHGGTTQLALAAAEDLLDDICRAIEADPRLGLKSEGVIDSIVDGTAYAGGDEGVSEGASVFAEVTVYAALTTGA